MLHANACAPNGAQCIVLLRQVEVGCAGALWHLCRHVDALPPRGSQEMVQIKDLPA